MDRLDSEEKPYTVEKIMEQKRNTTRQHIMGHYQRLSQWDERKLNQLFDCDKNVYRRVDNVELR